MSIKIEARRYIAELELSDRVWNEDKHPLDEGIHGLLVIELPDDFGLISAVFDGISWVAWNPDIGFYSAENIVCWSEIKI